MESKEDNIREQLQDITECCICCETLRDSRVLPCIHTFCLDCLEQIHSNSKNPGSTLPCPICRSEFVIPSGGMDKLPKNFFIERVIEMTKTTRPAEQREPAVCDACSEDNSEPATDGIPSATMRCVECQQNLCEECCKHHKKNKLTKTHSTVTLGEQVEESKPAESEPRIASGVCQTHLDIPVSRQMNLAATGDQMSIELVGSLETGMNNSIWGVTHLKNHIYVLSKHNKLILAFEAEAPFSLSREIPVREVAVPRDLAACDTRNCLYVVDDEGKAIWKIKCIEFTVNRWLTGIGNPFKISVTKDGRVLIPREGRPCTIELIGSNARLEKSIELPDEIKDIQYAIQSPRETFIISYGHNRSRNRGLLEISTEGHFLKTHSFPPEIWSEMKDPRHMAIGRGDRLFVTDCGNDRLIAFDIELQVKNILLNQRTGGIHMPYRVCYIDDKEYLIVVHSSGYKVAVYKCS